VFVIGAIIYGVRKYARYFNQAYTLAYAKILVSFVTVVATVDTQVDAISLARAHALSITHPLSLSSELCGHPLLPPRSMRWQFFHWILVL
jgi:hypothetical protein